MTVLIDPSTPGFTQLSGSNQTSLTSPTFSPPPWSLVLVCLAIDGPDTAQQSATSIMSSPALAANWSAFTQSSNFGTGPPAYGGNASLAWGFIGANPPQNLTVTCTFSQPVSTSGMLGILVLTGGNLLYPPPGYPALPPYVPGVLLESSGTDNQTLNASETIPLGALYMGVMLEYNADTAPTFNSGTSTTINGINYFLQDATNGKAYWVEIHTATGTGGIQTLGFTAPEMEYNAMLMAVAAAPALSAPKGPPPLYGSLNAVFG